eukprot:194244-Prymnesium_polylepis.1
MGPQHTHEHAKYSWTVTAHKRDEQTARHRETRVHCAPRASVSRRAVSDAGRRIHGDESLVRQSPLRRRPH